MNYQNYKLIMTVPNIITLNGNEISLIKVGIHNQLNYKQKALLMMMYDCIKNNKSFDWDKMVLFYIKNVKKEYLYYAYDYDFSRIGGGHRTNERYIKYDIMKQYKTNGDKWSWLIKPSIRQWFAVNIGSMVLKGSLLALPIIELD